MNTESPPYAASIPSCRLAPACDQIGSDSATDLRPVRRTTSRPVLKPNGSGGVGLLWTNREMREARFGIRRTVEPAPLFQPLCRNRERLIHSGEAHFKGNLIALQLAFVVDAELALGPVAHRGKRNVLGIHFAVDDRHVAEVAGRDSAGQLSSVRLER